MIAGVVTSPKCKTLAPNRASSPGPRRNLRFFTGGKGIIPPKFGRRRRFPVNSIGIYRMRPRRDFGGIIPFPPVKNEGCVRGPVTDGSVWRQGLAFWNLSPLRDHPRQNHQKRKDHFGKAAITGVRLAAVIESAASPVAPPEICAPVSERQHNANPISIPNHSTPIGFRLRAPCTSKSAPLHRSQSGFSVRSTRQHLLARGTQAG